MNNKKIKEPIVLKQIISDTNDIGFNMSSEKDVGAILRTLVASKAGKNNCLELGTGTGLSTAWILDGMNNESTLTTVDNDSQLLKIAKKNLICQNVEFVCSDGNEYIYKLKNENQKFDFIFADTWAGKYELIDETLDMLNVNGIYVIDDMIEQENWPEGHEIKVAKLIEYLHNRNDLSIVNLNWSCGVIICVKVKKEYK